MFKMAINKDNCYLSEKSTVLFYMLWYIISKRFKIKAGGYGLIVIGGYKSVQTTNGGSQNNKKMFEGLMTSAAPCSIFMDPRPGWEYLNLSK